MTIGYLFAYLGDGGAEENAMLLAKQAILSGHNVVFIVDKMSENAAKKLESEKIKTIHLSMESSFNMVSVRKSVAGLRKIVRNEKIDIVHSHMLREQSIAVLAKLLGSKFKLVRTFHRFDQFNAKMKPIMSIYRKFTDALISISSQMTDYLKSNGIGDKIFLITNGVEKVIAPRHDKAIGYIGRLIAEKGILKFIKSNVELLKTNKMIIAGDGPEYDKIKDYVEAKHLKVELMGKVIDKSKFYKKVSVLVLPSETEVLPLVVLEAYSCGIPVVAFNLESLMRLISINNGRLVEYADYFKLGQEAVSLLSESDSFYGANISRYEHEFSVRKMWEQTEALYLELINPNKK